MGEQESRASVLVSDSYQQTHQSLAENHSDCRKIQRITKTKPSQTTAHYLTKLGARPEHLRESLNKELWGADKEFIKPTCQRELRTKRRLSKDTQIDPNSHHSGK